MAQGGRDEDEHPSLAGFENLSGLGSRKMISDPEKRGQWEIDRLSWRTS
jgi:hypothetical protein